MPVTEEEIAHVLRRYEERGFPGYVGSIDCVHLVGISALLALSVHAKGRVRFQRWHLRSCVLIHRRFCLYRSSSLEL